MQTTQQQNPSANRKVAIGLWAVFITQFVSYLFINARNIAQPGIINELDGMALFSWLIALPALAGAASTLLFGKLSDIYGRRAILLLSIGIFLLGLGISARATTMAFMVPGLRRVSKKYTNDQTQDRCLGHLRDGARDDSSLHRFFLARRTKQAQDGSNLILISLAAWTGFLRIEQRAEAPILDPHIFMNRTFMTAAGAIFLSYFGMLGIMAYGPIFVQTVMNLSPTVSGTMQTPYTMIVAFMGIPTGFILARTRKYKWIYIIAYGIATIALFVMWQFTAVTPIWWYVVVTSLAGFGIGAIGTITTLVAQFAVPRWLLGAAVGAIFFFQMIGLVVAPSILGLAQNSALDLENGLKMVFLVGAVTMLIALLMILTIPEISMETESPEKSRLLETVPVER